MPTKFITWAGIDFQRKGSCNRCSGCFIDCTVECPHGIVDTDGKQTCTIHDTLDNVCEECTNARSSDGKGRKVTHSNCKNFPNHPLLHVLREKICAYSFTRTDHGSMNDLPGIKDGEVYDKS